MSLAKLKTLEYRLFRKMREKLRNFFSGDDQTKEKMNLKQSQFRREAKVLSDEHDLPRPLEYYFALFETAFDFIASDPKTNTELL